jgi:multimeric flavodoxin WrbA
MTKILRINSSSRLQGSHSRDLADIWEKNWLKHHPSDEIIIRELVETPIPHISDMTIAGYFTPKDQHTEEMQAATTLSDQLIEELLAADILLLSVPMYNFLIPSALKAYIDQIVRVGYYTFGFDEQKGIYGLIEFSISPKIDLILQQEILDIIESYWNPRINLLRNGYRSIDFPFEPIQVPLITMKIWWTLPELLAYMHTWSATRQCIQKQGTKFFETLSDKLLSVWGKSEEKREITMNFHIIAGRN